MGAAGCKSSEQAAPPSKETTVPTIIQRITITQSDIQVDEVNLDKVHLRGDISLRNDGTVPVEVDKIILSSPEETIEELPWISSLEPEEEAKEYLSFSLSRKFGIYQIPITIGIMNPSGQILGEKNIIVPIPVATIGDTIQIEPDLSLTLLSWKESNIAVNGPYAGGDYYIFKAKPDMKFIILTYEFKNNGIREQETPYLNEGEILTNKGYIYQLWRPIGGFWTSSRDATRSEIETLVGNSGGYEKLLPEESTIGRVVFEIPENAMPIEAEIIYLQPLIRF